MSLLSSVPNGRPLAGSQLAQDLKSYQKSLRRPPTMFGASELPICVDPEPYMNVVVTGRELLTVLQRASHIPVIGTACKRFAFALKEMIDSVGYYEALTDRKPPAKAA